MKDQKTKVLSTPKDGGKYIERLIEEDVQTHYINSHWLVVSISTFSDTVYDRALIVYQR
jgi:hypothetical protein